MKQINVRLPEDLLDELDLERGEIPRARWIRGAIEVRLGRRSAGSLTSPSLTEALRSEAFRQAEFSPPRGA
jgi:metal-responsive CopG/Arc/MetJ family transcriptional regulator